MRLIHGGSGPPLKLLAKAKSDENERRQRVADYGKRSFSLLNSLKFLLRAKRNRGGLWVGDQALTWI